MARYFFHIYKSGVLKRDPEGVELPSRAAALAEAVRAAQDALNDSVLGGDLVEDDEFEVRDEEGDILITLPFKAVLNIS